MAISSRGRSFCALLAVIALQCACAPQQGPASGIPESSPQPTAWLPLETTRVLSFTTSEGTWMSVDVSPDGRQIAFDLLGDLYTLPIGGGMAARITSGPAIDGQPRYSPDGKSIVYTSDRDGSENVWLIAPDGSSPRAVTTERSRQFQSPVWTPDGDSIVVVQRTRFASSAAHLRVYPRLGGPGRHITPQQIGPNDTWQGPAFGPDPRFVWYTRFGRDSTMRNKFVSTNQIAVYDRVAARDTVMLPKVEGGRMRPLLSRDGRWLVFGSRRGGKTALMLRDLRSGIESVLIPEMTQSAPYVDETRDAMPGAAFVPDSRAVVLSNRGKFWRISIPAGEAEAIPFSADVEQHLAPLARYSYPIDDSAYTVREVRDPRFSPDGKRVAFTAVDRVWVLDWPRGAPLRLTDRDAGERYPAWSPDGKYIAFVSWEGEDSSQAVFRARSDGSAPAERLTREPGHYRRLSYTPGGTRIVVSRGALPTAITAPRFAPDSARRLVWIPADGGVARVIGRDTDRGLGNRGNLPYVLARDTSIVYHGGATMKWDGTDRRTVATDQYYRAFISPDGRYALFDERESDIAIVALKGVDSITSITWNPGRRLTVRHVSTLGGDYASWTDDGRWLVYSLGATVVRIAVSCIDSLPQSHTGFVDIACPPERHDVVIKLPPDRAQGTVVLRGGKIITMRGAEIIRDGNIVVHNGRIIAVGPRNSVPVPSGARVIDIAGKTVIPGFVDVHSHARGFSRNGRGGIARYTGPYKDEAHDYMIPLAFGVTTQRDPQAPSEMFGHADMIKVGDMLGPRQFPTGPGIGSSNWSEEERARDWGDVMTGPQRALEILTRYGTYFRTTQVKEYQIGDRRTRQWFNMAARALQLGVTSEGSRSDAKSFMGRMLDGNTGHEHYIAFAPLYEDMLRLIAFSGTVYTPTLGAYAFGAPKGYEHFLAGYDVAGDPRLRALQSRAMFDTLVVSQKSSRRDSTGFWEQASALAPIARLGGTLAVGGHGEGAGLDVHFEIWAMASRGLPAHEGLRAATINGAYALGRDRDLGSIEEGKLADLIVLEADPLVDVRNSITVRNVMQNGRLYDAYTMNEIWPRERALARQWWLETK